MGVEYSLVKVGTAESYYLGKTAMREPSADWQTRAKGIHPIRDAMRWLAIMQPSPSAMWRIGTDDGNMAIMVLPDRWSPENLADLVNVACLDADDPARALRIARDMLEWAGRDEVILIPDDAKDQIKDRFGIDPDELRVVRSIRDAALPERHIAPDRNPS